MIKKLKMKRGNLFKRMGLTSRSTATNSEGSVSSAGTLQPPIPSSRYYTSCQLLPLIKFIDVYVSEDLKHLIIEGPVPDYELLLAWENLLSEYAGYIKSDQSRAILMLNKRIQILTWKITFIDYALRYLRKKFNQELIDDLRAMGYTYPFNWEIQTQYLGDLKAVESLSKTMIAQKRELLVEYERMTNGNGKGAKKTREDWEREIAMLSKYQGSRIDKLNTMAAEYAAILSNHNEEVAAINKLRARHGEVQR